MAEIEETVTRESVRLRALKDARDWDRLTRLREPLFGAATRQMLEAARLKPGEMVLDIAAGTGDQSRLAACLVGPTGSVLATDISQEMLDVGARHAAREGLHNIATRAMNAEQLDLPDDSFDAVISRLGLMLVSRQREAFMEMRRVLRPGGRLAALVWSRPERNPLFALYIAFVRNPRQPEAWRLDSRMPAYTGAFSLADAAHFARLLTEAGFRDVQVQALALTFRFPSFETLTTWWGSDFDAALAELEPALRERALADIRREVSRFEESQGIAAPAELLLGIGTK